MVKIKAVDRKPHVITHLIPDFFLIRFQGDPILHLKFTHQPRDGKINERQDVIMHNPGTSTTRTHHNIFGLHHQPCNGKVLAYVWYTSQPREDRSHFGSQAP